MAGSDEDDFKPKFGRLGDAGKGASKSYVKRVLKAAGKRKPGFARKPSGSGRSGRKLIRGERALSLNRYPVHQRRRVIVKARIVKLAGSGLRQSRVHLSYIQRGGVTKTGEPGKLYNSVGDDVDGDAFLEKGREDRHQFRFIISPEDAHELVDMKAYIRDLMDQAQKDLKTKLDWIAVDHYNTDNPHTHIIMRGVTDQGKDLVIARKYMSQEFRARASELATLELGPREQHEIENAIRKEVTQDRFTSLDKGLLSSADKNIVDMRGEPAGGYPKFKHSLKVGRLRKLELMGLAEEFEPGRWRLSDQTEKILRDLGTRTDIIKMMHAEMSELGRDPISTDYEIFRPAPNSKKKIVGRLISKGLADELNDRFYVVVDGVDGKTYYADIGRHDDIDAFKADTVVEVSVREAGPTRTDQTIAHVAARNNGLYSEDLHAAFDKRASTAFIQTHLRRLEAMRREGITRRFLDGSWEVPDDYLDQVAARAKSQSLKSPVTITTRSYISVDAQANAPGATWLDRRLMGQEQSPMSNTGFGGEVEEAMKHRRAYLITEGLAQKTARGFAYQTDLLKTLEQRELKQVAESITATNGKAFKALQKGDQVDGTFTRSMELSSGKYALIEKSHEFSLAPWRAVLERVRGRHVSGVVSGAGVSWDIGGKKKGLGV